MDKVICDVCGTQYPESAEQCPICGSARVSAGTEAAEAVAVEETVSRSTTRVKGGRFSKENVQKRNQGIRPETVPVQQAKEVTRRKAPEQAPVEEKAVKQNKDVVINVLLVIVIVALLAVIGFIAKEFFLPANSKPTVPTESPTVATEAPTTETTEEPTTTIPPVPCTEMSLPEDDSGEVMLHAVGQSWLLNVTVLPEDTTDDLIFTSGNDQIAYVSSEGRITAVGEGETEILISCGDQQISYKVICDFLLTGGEGAGNQPSDGTAVGTTAPTGPLKDVTLKVNLTDITFNDKNQGYTFKVDGLTNEEVTWTSENENIVKVENGRAISVGRGNTNIIAQYGDQKVTIIIRCVF